MKKYLDKYYNFIGIKNEGFRRIVSLIIYSHLILLIYVQLRIHIIPNDFLLDLLTNKEYPFGIHDRYYYLYYPPFGLMKTYIAPFITYTILFKLIAWIVDGFKGEIID